MKLYARNDKISVIRWFLTQLKRLKHGKRKTRSILFLVVQSRIASRWDQANKKDIYYVSGFSLKLRNDICFYSVAIVVHFHEFSTVYHLVELIVRFLSDGLMPRRFYDYSHLL